MNKVLVLLTDEQCIKTNHYGEIIIYIYKFGGIGYVAFPICR